METKKKYLTEDFWALNIIFVIFYLAIDENWRWLMFTGNSDEHGSVPLSALKTEEIIKNHLIDLEKIASIENSKLRNKKDDYEFTIIYARIVRRLLLDNGVLYEEVMDEKYRGIYNFSDFQVRLAAIQNEIISNSVEECVSAVREILEKEKKQNKTKKKQQKIVSLFKTKEGK